MASSYAKKNTAPAMNKIFVLAGVVAFIVIIAVCFITGLITVKNTVADIIEFKVGDKFIVNINRDVALYNEPAGNDMLVVYMSAKNVTPDPGEFEVENTTGYDDDTPTVDELSEEERNNLSYEESERINEKTFNEINKKLYKRKSVGGFMGVNASQDGRVLEEPSGIYRAGGEDDDGNDISLNKSIESGETYYFYLIYQLHNQEPMQLTFSPVTSDENVEVEETVVTFDISKRISGPMRAILNEQNAQTASKKQVKSVEFKGLTISLIDGWYADEEMTANIRLKNDNFENGQLSISYDSSGNAKSSAEKSLSWIKVANPPSITTVDINGRTYYYYSVLSSSFVLTTDAQGGVAYKFTGQNVSLDDVRPLLESLTF